MKNKTWAHKYFEIYDKDYSVVGFIPFEKVTQLHKSSEGRWFVYTHPEQYCLNYVIDKFKAQLESYKRWVDGVELKVEIDPSFSPFKNGEIIEPRFSDTFKDCLVCNYRDRAIIEEPCLSCPSKPFIESTK